MIIGNRLDFFIQIEEVYKLGNFRLGIFNFWIDGVSFPGEGCSLTIESISQSLIFSRDRLLKFDFSDSDIYLSKFDFSLEEEEEKNLMYMDLGELSDYGFNMFVGVDKNCAKIFYKKHKEEYSVIKIPFDYFVNILSIDI